MPHLLFGNAVILMFIIAGASRRMPLYSPLMLSACIWQAVFITGLAFGGMFYPLKEQAFVMWLLWFATSSLFFFCLSNQALVSSRSLLRKLPFDYTPILVGLILWLAYQIWIVGKSGPAYFFTNLRLSSAHHEGYELLGFVGRLYPWVFALFLFEHVNARKDNRRIRRLLWCWILLYALATMGKLALLTPCLAWAIVRGVRGDFPLRRVIMFLPLFFGLMIGFQIIRAMVSEQFVLSKFMSIYIYSPIVALGYMEIPLGTPWGAHVFRFFYALMHPIIGGAAPVPVIQDYISVPYLTNTYTVIQPFIVDFGLPGVLFGSAFYGIFFGWLFQLGRTHRQLPLMIYAGLSVILVGQFIGEFLFTMLSGHLQFVLAAVIFTSLSRRADHGG